MFLLETSIYIIHYGIKPDVIQLKLTIFLNWYNVEASNSPHRGVLLFDLAPINGI
jgi:hypothetical protein